MTQEEAAQLLQKYLAGNTNQEETNLVEEWYGSLPERAPLSDVQKMRIATQMRTHIKNAIHQGDHKKNGFRYGPWIRIAALLLVLLSFSLLFWRLNKTADHSQVHQVVIGTPINERKEVILPDGSSVMLEPSSKISYPSHFPTEKRVVTLLSGEAFFAVVHEPKRPFSVQLQSKLLVKVLGTSFRIRDRGTEDLLKVTVATGKVAVENGGQLLNHLIKGEELQFDKRTKLASINKVQAQVVKLSFHGAPLAQLVEKLAYVYSIKIQVDNPQLLKLKTTAQFNSAQSPAEILDIVCRLHHLRFSENKANKTFKIYR